nr:glucan endo-1,3-beta-glucosidase [Quercus suber]
MRLEYFVLLHVIVNDAHTVRLISLSSETEVAVIDAKSINVAVIDASVLLPFCAIKVRKAPISWNGGRQESDTGVLSRFVSQSKAESSTSAAPMSTTSSPTLLVFLQCLYIKASEHVQVKMQPRHDRTSCTWRKLSGKAMTCFMSAIDATGVQPVRRGEDFHLQSHNTDLRLQYHSSPSLRGCQLQVTFNSPCPPFEYTAMRGYLSLALVASSTLLSQALALPSMHKRASPVHPGGVSDIVITKENTINATSTQPASSNAANANAQLPLTFTNNFGGGAVNAYVTGLDSNGALVILQPDGTFFHPTADASQSAPVEITQNIAIPLNPQGQDTTISIPDFITSGRIWFAEGTLHFYTVASASGMPSLVTPSAANPSDPSADINWGFVELTNNDSGIFANISYVDFVGLPLGMTLTAGDGSTQSAEGLTSGAVGTICSGLASVGGDWASLCQAGSNGNPLRVVAPGDYVAGNPGAFADYWTSYIDQVYTKYSTSTLTVDTQAAAGHVACTVSGDVMSCAGSDVTYAKPTAGDIFGCNSGPFANPGGTSAVNQAVVPRLCAAFNRATLLLDGGDVQPSLPSSSYYTTMPNNVYSSLVHQNEPDGRGYAFAYDDVNPTGENASGVVSDANPQKLQLGWGSDGVRGSVHNGSGGFFVDIALLLGPRLSEFDRLGSRARLTRLISRITKSCRVHLDGQHRFRCGVTTAQLVYWFSLSLPSIESALSICRVADSRKHLAFGITAKSIRQYVLFKVSQLLNPATPPSKCSRENSKPPHVTHVDLVNNTEFYLFTQTVAPGPDLMEVRTATNEHETNHEHSVRCAFR